MTKVNEIPNANLYQVDAEGTQLKVMHVFGDTYERGYAQGSIFADETVAFATEKLDYYFTRRAIELDLDFLPPWVAKIVHKYILDPTAAKLFDSAMMWVWDVQKFYIHGNPTKILDEIKGMADGICD